METKNEIIRWIKCLFEFGLRKIRMTRLGFFIHFNRTWMGGINVILNLINLIYEDKDYKAKPRIQIIIFTNSKKSEIQH